MNALVYHGPGKMSWDNVPDPVIQQPTDAIVSIDLTTICGTDLHILKGDVPETKPGTILGHEAVGTIVEADRRSPPSRKATTCCCPVSAPADAASTASRDATAPAPAAEDGSLGTPSTGPRPTSCAFRSRIPPSTRSRRA